jgi:hypothetical protein
VLDGWDIVQFSSDNAGRLWIGGIHDASDTICLALFDGKGWVSNVIPTMVSDPRTWWRQKDLSELYSLSISPDSIDTILKNPEKYRGQKISVVGQLSYGFELSTFTDMEGRVFAYQSSFHIELDQRLSTLEINSAGSPKQYLGYIEYNGPFGHLGSNPYQLYITEVYPYPYSQSGLNKYTQQYEKYFIQYQAYCDSIMPVIRDWQAAMRVGDIEWLQRIYVKNSKAYQNLITPQPDSIGNKLDIKIIDYHVLARGESAVLAVDYARLEPDQYCLPEEINGIRGLIGINSIELQFIQNQWKKPISTLLWPRLGTTQFLLNRETFLRLGIRYLFNTFLTSGYLHLLNQALSGI